MRTDLLRLFVSVMLFPPALLMGQCKCADTKAEPPTFDFRWTSSGLLELVATTPVERSLEVKICEYPVLMDTVPEVVKFIKPKSLRVSPTSWFHRPDSSAIIIFREEDNAALLEAKEKIVLPTLQPGAIICDTTSHPFDISQPFYVMGWNGKKFSKLILTVPETTYTVSKISVRRRHERGAVVSLVEDELGRPLVSECDHAMTISRDPAPISSFLAVTSAASAVPMDTITVRTILPREAGFEVEALSPERVYYETPWIKIHAGPNGIAAPICLPSQFRLIDFAGRVRVKYRSIGKEEESLDAIVMDRHKLAIEIGSVFNTNADGSPIGKLAYSIFAESLWKRNLLGEASVERTYLRLPTQFDPALQKNTVKIAPIVEGDISLTWDPFVDSDFEPRSIAFAGDLFVKSSSLDDSTDIQMRMGGGLGIVFEVPAFNEKRSAKDFGRAAGYVSVMFNYDSFWPDARFRLRTDFRLDLLKLGSDAVTISLKGRLDYPLKPYKPSDVRLGISSTIDASTIAGLAKAP